MGLINDSSGELKLLLRNLRSEVFRFVVVQHNHPKIIDLVVEQIKSTYPNRCLSRERIADRNYRSLMTTVYQSGDGVLVLEDFASILNKPELYVGFNQRRDKITQNSLALICFVPSGDKVLRNLMQKMPDLWSFRNLVVELLWEPTDQSYFQKEPSTPATSTLGGGNVREKEKELNRLVSRIIELQKNSNGTSLLLTLYPQALQLLEDLGAYQKGVEYAKQFAELSRIDGDESQPSDYYADALDWQAKFYRYLRDYHTAKIYFQKALEVDKAKYDNNHPRVAGRQWGLATVCQELGEYLTAKELLEEAIASDKNSGGDHRLVAGKQSSLAVVYHELGEYEKARRLMEKALNYGLARQEESRIVAERLSGLALIYKDMNNLGRAQDLLEQALKLDIENFGADHPSVAVRQSNLAMVYRSAGRYARAQDLSEQALASAYKHFGTEDTAIIARLSNLAVVYIDLEEYDQARELLEQVLSIAERHYGLTSDTVGKTKINLGRVYERLGLYGRAKNQWKAAHRILRNTRGDDHPYTKMVVLELKRIQGQAKRARSKKRY